MSTPDARPNAGQGPNGKFLPGNRLAKGNPMAGRVEQFRAVLLEVAQERFSEVANKLLDLAAEGERWAVELVFDRCLGKVPEPPSSLTQVNLGAMPINISLPDPPGGRHVVRGLLDAEP